MSIEDGLSQNMVNTVFQDSKGFMWFGTKDGLNKYDGYTFKIYKVESGDSSSVSDNHITAIYEDDLNNLWIGTRFGGLNIYDSKRDAFVKINPGIPKENMLLISSITGNSKNGIWLSSMNGHIIGLDISGSTKNELPKVRLKKFVEQKDLNDIIPESAYLDESGLLWIPSNKGLVRYHTRTEKIDTGVKNFPTYVVDVESSNKSRTRNDALSPTLHKSKSIFRDEKGMLWIPGIHGLYQIDVQTQEITFYKCRGEIIITAWPFRNQNKETEVLIGTYRSGIISLNFQSKTVRQVIIPELSSDDLLTQIYSGKDGTIWMATNGRGIYYYSPVFNIFKNDIPSLLKGSGKQSMSIYNVFPYTNNGEKNLILSTLTYSIFWNQTRGTFTKDSTFYIRNTLADRQNNLWIGSNLGLIKYITAASQRISIDTTDKIVTGIYQDQDDNIWYSTPSALKVYLHKTGEIRSYIFYDKLEKNKHQFQETMYSCIQVDIDQTLWIGTANGLFHFDMKKKKFLKRYLHDPANSKSINFNEIKSILLDPKHPEMFLWIGTSVGLNKMNKKTGEFISYTTKDGLPNNTVYGILSDKKGNLWLSTNQGLSVFNPVNKTVINFDVKNGLQSNEFNTGAYFKKDDGEMFFGGINGLNRFYPEDVLADPKTFSLVISDIQLLGPNQNRKIFYTQETANRLTHNQNNISITLSALQYASPEKVQYAYRIINKDTSWIPLGKNRNVNLTNLSPGKYIFQAKSTDIFGQWNPEYLEIVFIISPPWWSSLLAKIIYLFLIAGSLYYLWHWNQRRIIQKHVLENERKAAAAIMELDKVKSRFLTNITHEFRTPLTLINGHIEVFKEVNLGEKLERRLDEMENNSHRLLQLINQLMDLSKLDNGEYKLTYQRSNVLTDYRVVCASFHSYAEQKSITTSFEVDPDAEIYFEQTPFNYSKDAFVTILTNLLSNACKFTPENGEIKTRLTYLKASHQIMIEVSDTGSGISEKDIEKIFDRFFQSDSTSQRRYEGSGVGLSLVKELAELHGGTATVKSKINEGTVFTITLKEGHTITEVVNGENTQSTSPKEFIYGNESPFSESDEDIPLILLVEDHTDLRRFIRESLGEQYRFVEAVNGKEGVDAAANHVPDIIISDVMMPEMDGIEFCRTIKKSDLTSHIPVILLTAKAGQEDKMIGLETGADDYLTKPFSARELRVRIQNILSTQRRLREKSQRSGTIGEVENLVLSVDDRFVAKVRNIILENISNPELSPESLSELCNMTRIQLNRKLKSITGMTTIFFFTEYQNGKSNGVIEK